MCALDVSTLVVGILLLTFSVASLASDFLLPFRIHMDKCWRKACPRLPVSRPPSNPRIPNFLVRRTPNSRAF